MTPQELRNSILQRAMEGKLVEQRPEEGTGKDLYELIQEEKNRLVKEGKIKKQKALSEIKEDEIPFDIPDSWKWVRIGNIFQHNTGKALNSKNQEGLKLEYITTSNLYWDRFELENLKEMYFKKSELEKCKVSKGDLLVCEGGDIGRSAIWKEDYSIMIQNHIHRLKSYKDIQVKFFYFLFYLYKSSGLIGGKGIGIKGLSSRALSSIIFPLPPLIEQNRIVEKIEELLPLVDEYEKNWEKLEDLNKKFPEDMKKSLIQEAIKGKLVEQRPEEGTGEDLYKLIQEEKNKLIQEGKIKKQKALPEIKEDEMPFDIPESWKWCKLGDIINFNIGKTPPRAEPEWWGNDVPWVSISDMIDYGYINYTKEKVTDSAIDTKFQKLIKKDTLLMSFKLTVGRTSILGVDAVHNEAIISIDTFIDNNNSFRNYLFYLLPLIASRGDSKKAIKGKTLNTSSINNLLVPLPPLREQERLVEKLEELLPLCDQLAQKQ